MNFGDARFVKAEEPVEFKVAVMKYWKVLENIVAMCAGFHLAQLFACLFAASHLGMDKAICFYFFEESWGGG